MIPVNILARQTDARAHRTTPIWTFHQVAVDPGAIRRAAHHAGVAQDPVHRTTTVTPVPIVVCSLALAEDRVRHQGLILAMATLAITVQVNLVLSLADAPGHLQVPDQAPIHATMTRGMTCTPLVRSLAARHPALTTDAHVALVGARVMVGEMISMK